MEFVQVLHVVEKARYLAILSDQADLESIVYTVLPLSPRTHKFEVRLPPQVGKVLFKEIPANSPKHLFKAAKLCSAVS